MDLFFKLAAEAPQSGFELNSSSLIWAVLTLVAIVVEIGTVSLVSLWFIPGMVLALILSFIPGIPIVVEIITFVIVTAVCFVLFRKKFKEKMGASKVATNADVVIGMTAIVTEDINNILASGAVKVAGKEWSARSEDQDIIINRDELVRVVRIEGVKLICRRCNTENKQ